MQLLWLGVAEKQIEYKQLIELDKRCQPKVYFAYKQESVIGPFTDIPFLNGRVNILFEFKAIFIHLLYLLQVSAKNSDHAKIKIFMVSSSKDIN